jgi:sugar lactone lactonase YvrE
MLKGMVRAVLLLGLVVAVPALSLIQAATVVFVSLRFGEPPAIGAFAFGGGGNIIQLPSVADATYPPGRIAIGPDGKIYLVEGRSVTVYAPGAHGNVPPLATISGSRTELESPLAIAVDSRGTIYVTNVTDKGITIYAPGSNGNVAPIATISGGNTGLAGPTGIAVDSIGKIYVANMRGNCVTVYSAGSHGNVKPVATIIGKVKYPVWFEPHGIAVATNGRIYVLLQDAINVYSAGSNGASAPIAVISVPITGALTDIALDSSGKIYLTNSVAPLLSFRSQVLVYSAASTGNASPIAVIEGSKTGLDYPGGVAVDAGGKIYVTNGGISVFSGDSKGNVKPITKITSNNTGLTQPYGVAVGSDGKIYVADKHVGSHSCGRVLVYRSGSYGDALPMALIEGAHTVLQQPIGIAVDSRGNVYVTNQEGINQCGAQHSTVADINRATPYASVTVYSADSIASGGGDVPPVATIGGIGSQISSVALDSSGKIYATSWSPASVRIYPASSNRNVPPDAIIVGSQTRLDSPQAIALDSSGKIYVANARFGADPQGDTGSITVYPAGSNGNVTPTAVIRGAKTLVNRPVGLAVDQSGAIYLVNSNAMTVYPPGANGNVAPFETIDDTSKIRIGGAQFSGIAIAPP